MTRSELDLAQCRCEATSHHTRCPGTASWFETGGADSELPIHFDPATRGSRASRGDGSPALHSPGLQCRRGRAAQRAGRSRARHGRIVRTRLAVGRGGKRHRCAGRSGEVPHRHRFRFHLGCGRQHRHQRACGARRRHDHHMARIGRGPRRRNRRRRAELRSRGGPPETKTPPAARHCRRFLRGPEGRTIGLRHRKSIRSRPIADDRRDQRAQARVADDQGSRGRQHHSDRCGDLSRQFRRSAARLVGTS